MMFSNILKFKWHITGLLFIFLVVFTLLKGLTRDTQSQTMLNQPFPMLKIEDLSNNRNVKLSDLTQEPSVVHIWASWCGVCLKEHHQWLNIKKKYNFPIVGIVYRDDSDTVLNFLSEKGSPYDWILNDKSGKLGVALGLIGTPQTFLVDGKGMIMYQYLGAIDESTFEKHFLPRLNQAKSSKGV